MAGQKSLRVTNAIAQLLPNTGGPKQAARRLLATVTSSTMMYGAPIWYAATAHESYVRAMKSAHRLASLRVCCAFRTVSNAAASVIAGRMPIALQAKKAAAVRNLRKMQVADRSRRAEAEANLLMQCQQEWDESPSGRWTHSLIPNLGCWLKRKHGEPNYYVTQFLTGHGCFREYLYKYKHVEHPFCLFCVDHIENVEHVFTECPRFNSGRLALEQVLNETVTCVGIVQQMTESSEKWQKINHIVTTIMQQLRRDEQCTREQ